MIETSALGVAREHTDWEAVQADAVLEYLYKRGAADATTLARVTGRGHGNVDFPLSLLLGKQLIEISERRDRNGTKQYIYTITYLGSLLAAACLASLSAKDYLPRDG